jgi:hypothetical protein
MAHPLGYHHKIKAHGKQSPVAPEYLSHEPLDPVALHAIAELSADRNTQPGATQAIGLDQDQQAPGVQLLVAPLDPEKLHPCKQPVGFLKRLAAQKRTHRLLRSPSIFISAEPRGGHRNVLTCWSRA